MSVWNLGSSKFFEFICREAVGTQNSFVVSSFVDIAAAFTRLSRSVTRPALLAPGHSVTRNSLARFSVLTHSPSAFVITIDFL